MTLLKRRFALLILLALTAGTKAHAQDKADQITIQRAPYSYAFLLTPLSVELENVHTSSDTCVNVVCIANPGYKDSLSILDASFARANEGFRINSTKPPLPTKLGPGDTLIIQLCFIRSDTLAHHDTLWVNPCAADVQLFAQATAGSFYASNIDFKTRPANSEKCDTLRVVNNGKLPFTINGVRILDTVHFTLDAGTTFPMTLKPRDIRFVRFCYHPTVQGFDSTAVEWLTSLSADAPATKWSILKGTATSTQRVSRQMMEGDLQITDLRPNPASQIINFTINGLMPQGFTIEIIDVLGKVIRSSSFASEKTSTMQHYDVSNLVEGSYTLRVVQTGQRTSKRFTVKR